MALPPLKLIFIFSIVTGYILVTVAPKYLPTQSFVYTFMMVYGLVMMPWMFYSVYLYPFHLSPLRHIPTVKGGNWFTGHFWTEITSPIGHPMKNWTYSTPNEGLVRYLSLFNSERLIVTNAKALSEVTVTNCYDYAKPKFAVRQIRKVLGDGIVLAEGDTHKVQRKNMMPAFAFRHIKDLYPTFWRKSRDAALAMTEEVQQNLGKPNLGNKKAKDVEVGSLLASIAADQAVIDSGAWASRATLDIIGIASAGMDFGAISDPTGELFTTYQEIFQESLGAKVSAVCSIIFPSWFVNLLPLKRDQALSKASGLVRGIARDLLRVKKQKLEKNQSAGNDILSIALESDAFSEENLVDQMMTFLAAGHETTASSVTWALYMLCLYPGMQTRLRAEIRSKLPSLMADATVTSLDIDHLPYLNAFCNEILRYWAPITLTMRSALVDTNLLGQRIPKGTTIMIAPIATNHDTKFWGPTAAQFDPDRWIANVSGGATSNFANMTFLQGPRSCIGSAFSKAEFACLLAAWVGRFEFELNDPEQRDESNILVRGGGSLRPRGGMWVKTRIIDGW